MNACSHFLEMVMSKSEQQSPAASAAVLARLREVLSGFPAVGLAVLFGSVAAGWAPAGIFFIFL